MKKDYLSILKLLLMWLFSVAVIVFVLVGGFDDSWSFVGYGGLMENYLLLLCFLFPVFLFYKRYSKSLLKAMWLVYTIMLSSVIFIVFVDLLYYKKPLLESRFFDALWVVLFMIVFVVLVDFSDLYISFIKKKLFGWFGWFSELLSFGKKTGQNKNLHLNKNRPKPLKERIKDKRMFFNDVGSLNYRTQRFNAFDMKAESLDRNIHEDSYNWGAPINWTFKNSFLAFDLLRYYFYLECEAFNSSNTKNNRHGVIRHLFDPYVERYGLEDGEVMSISDLPVETTIELGETTFVVGDEWIFDVEKRFNENRLEKELLRKINIKQKSLIDLEKRLEEKELFANKERSSAVDELNKLERQFRSNRLDQLNKKEKRRHCACQLLAKSFKKLDSHLIEKNWFWSLPYEMELKLGDLHYHLNVGGPFFPVLNNGPDISGSLGSEIDQKIVDVWGVISKDLYDFFLRNFDLVKTPKNYPIIEKYSSLLKKLELSVGRIKREWVVKTQGTEASRLFSHLPEKIELYCWVSFYSIRKQYFKEKGFESFQNQEEDGFLNLIEFKLNSIEEKYREELETQSFNSLISRQISEIEEKTEALKDDFVGVYNDIKTIKEQGDRTERVIEKIFYKLEKAYNKEDYRSFVEKVKSWFLYWEKTEDNTKVFMSGAEFFFNKTLSSNYVDYAAFVLYYCRALENELLIKMFCSFIDNFGENHSMFLLDDSGLSEKKKKEYSFFAKDFKRKFINKKFTLGDMKMVLERLPKQNQKTHPLYHRYPVLKQMFLYFKDKSLLLDSTSLELLSKLNNEYRRKAAHLEIIKKDEALRFYKIYKKVMNEVMSLFS